MKLHELKPNEGKKKNRKRICRGTDAGQGKTGGRGMKGQNSRSGSGGNLYRQGGNLSLFRKLPFMRGEGFRSVNRLTYNEINIGHLERFKTGTEVTPQLMADEDMLHKKNNPVVILGEGEIKNALTVKAHRFSKSAREKIEAAGGKALIIEES